MTETTVEPFEARLDRTKLVLLRRYPWAWRTLTSIRTLVERPDGTLAVDRWHRLYFNRECVDELTDVELTGAVWHEANHILRAHHVRLDPDTYRDRTTANRATDAEINGELRRGGVLLPDWVIYPGRLGLPGGLIAEDYYSRLKAREDVPPMPEDEDDDGEGGGGDEGDEQGRSSGDDDDEDGDADGDGTGGDGEGADGGDVDDTETGGGESSGVHRDDGLPVPQCGTGGAGSDDGELPEPDADEQAKVERGEREQAREVLGGGYSPETFGRGIVEGSRIILGRGKVDWRAVLASLIRNALEQSADESEDYTYRRRSRRADAAAPGIIPGAVRPVPRLVVVVDVSASMDWDKLSAAMTETANVLGRAAVPEFDAVAWDTEYRTTVRVRSPRDVLRLLDAPAGGGTDMVSGIRYAIAQGAEVVLCMTDAQCEWTARPESREVPVVVGHIDRSDNPWRNPPAWLSVVEVENGGERR